MVYFHHAMRWALLIFAALLLIGGAILLFRQDVKPPESAIDRPPTSAPSTAPVAATTKPKPRPADYMDVVRIQYPEFPTTQPLMVPVSMHESARLTLADPVYLDPLGELWITRADAESTPTVFKTVHEKSAHVLRENVVFVHRWPDEKGIWQPRLICRKEDGNYEIVSRTARLDIPSASHAFDWTRAFSWNESIVVPTDRGISILRPSRLPMEIHHEFIPADQYEKGKFSQVQALLDWRGLVAWMPWEEGKIGSNGAARFVNDKWALLNPDANWPTKILHLVPLLDGSVLQLKVNEQNQVELALAVLDPAEVDPKKITDLVEQLSHDDPEKRAAAFTELTRYGLGIWPMLEKLQPDQPPEAKMRLQQILNAKTEPMLGGMILQPGPLKVLARSDVGGTVLYADAGVAIPREGATQPRFVSPAWISIQPGAPIELLPDALTAELKVQGRQLRIVRGEFILNDDALGPHWWLSNHLSSPLLKTTELEFRQLIGQDRRGRWLFRKNLTDSSPTLIIDPTLPDPSPRLPVWVPHMAGTVGWTADNWPAIKSGGAWALVENDWRVIDEQKEKFISAADAPTTAPTSAPGLGVAILTEVSGTRFYDGRETLHMIGMDGRDITWPLPPEAVGSTEPILIRAAEDRLYLFNSPGRVVRIRQTSDDSQPFKVEAIFTKHIPNTDHADRIWLDPAGRIIIASEGKLLAICFPSGRIPPDIAKKMTARELHDAEE